MGKAIKSIFNNFKYGDKVYVYIEYEGIVEGIIKGINNNIDPYLYIVDVNGNKTTGNLEISQLHTFATYHDANSFLNYSVRDEVINLCDKLGIDISSCKMRINAFVRDSIYKKSFIDRFLGKNVEIKLDNEQLLNGILTYCKYYKAKDGVVSENFYYLKTNNASYYTTFKLSDIKKIKEKE